jgi:hypothetical protein
MALPSVVRVLDRAQDLVRLDALLAEAPKVEQPRGLVEVRDGKEGLHLPSTPAGA